MQLYNKLSAEERAQLIDDAGKDRYHPFFLSVSQDRRPPTF